MLFKKGSVFWCGESSAEFWTASGSKSVLLVFYRSLASSESPVVGVGSSQLFLACDCKSGSLSVWLLMSGSYSGALICTESAWEWGLKTMGLDLVLQLHQFCIIVLMWLHRDVVYICWKLTASCNCSVFFEVAFLKKAMSVCKVVCKSWKWSGS